MFESNRARAIFRVVAISVVYLAVWLGLHYLATAPTGNSINPWYLGAAVTFYLLYTCGVRYAPLPILAEILRAVIDPLGVHHPLWFYVAYGTIDAIGYAGAAYVTRNVLRINLPFVGIRDAARYCAVAAVAPLVIGIPVVAMVLGGNTDWNHYLGSLLTFWVGDSVGLFVLVPVLAMYLTPHLAPWTVSPESRDDDVPISLAERTILYVILIVSVVLGYAVVPAGISPHPVLYFTFLPLVWLASRGGLRVAVTGIVCADLATTLINALLRSPGVDAVELQSYIVVSALTSLAIGALVSDHHRSLRHSQLLAFRDPLTGLATRRSFEEWLEDAAAPLTVVTLDIDRMKLANDGLDRADSDELLRLVALRLQFLEAPFVAQVGPDQFACAFSGDDEPENSARTVLALFDDPFALEEGEVFISATMGVAIAHRASDLAGVLRRADVAMYRAKRAGRGGFTIYTAEMESSEANLSLAAELHRAFRENEFVLYYQPLYRVEDGSPPRCIGAEALIRWNHPRLGILEPSAFLDLLESLSLAEKVGSWVLHEACRQLRVWSAAGPDLSVWVNLFPRQAMDPGFPDDVTHALMSHKIRPERLVLEIVERVFGENESDVAEAIRGMRALGVRIAIDDFGTGHSSLSRLREAPAQILKIDSSFVKRSEVDPRARAVIHAVLQIAEELRLTPLAEGIETEAQMRLVTEQGCKLVQGYYLARPMPASEVERLLMGAPFR